MHFLKFRLPTFLVALLALTQASCGEKSRFQYEAAQFRLTAAENKATFEKLQAESAALGNLGRYQNPQKEQLPPLRTHIEALTKEGKNLKATIETAKADVEIIQRELDEYRARHAR